MKFENNEVQENQIQENHNQLPKNVTFGVTEDGEDEYDDENDTESMVTVQKIEDEIEQLRENID